MAKRDWKPDYQILVIATSCNLGVIGIIIVNVNSRRKKNYELLSSFLTNDIS